MSVRGRLARFCTLALAVMAGALFAAPAAARPVDAPLARFENPICPGIAGLEVEAAEMLVWRIRENLEAFGRRLAPPETCEANLLVMFVPDAGQSIERWRQTDAWLFSDMDAADREQLFNETGPVRVVLRIVPRTRDGIVVSRRDNLVDVPQATAFMAHSKIYSAIRMDIVSAQVLIDRDAAQGLTLFQLADYVTFRALTRSLPQTDEARAASILSLFDGVSDRPKELTGFDRAYLGELYSGIPNIPGTMRELALEQATGVDIFKQ